MWNLRKQAGRILQSGFTLVEVMITVAVLSVGILGASGMVATTIRGNAMAKNVTVANQLAEMEMERWMEQCRVLSQRGAMWLQPTSYAYGQIVGYPAYRMVITPQFGTPVGYSVTLSVQVFWKVKGVEHSVLLGGHTYVTADGVDG